MSSSWGENIQITLFGESHGKGVGCVLSGLPSGLAVSEDYIKKMMARRAPGKTSYGTKRKEPDAIEILSGIYNGHTTGTPIACFVGNKDVKSEDYENLPLRPSHGDYTGIRRYQGYGDPRGGGHFSARLTAPLVFAGAVAKQILENQFNITIGGGIKQIYTVKDIQTTSEKIQKEDIIGLENKDFPVFSDTQGNKMIKEIEKAQQEQDSLGGIVTCWVLGVPPGIGSPIFSGLENKIASIIFGIPGVRGIEFGTGFHSVLLKGSEHNDQFIIENDEIKTGTNHHGGILGGISSGMPIEFSVSFKPTPSIPAKQKTVDYMTKTEREISVKGRHDPCIVPRAVPVVEAAAALTLLDALLEGGNTNAYWNIPSAT